jgi:Tol biopolymer transport system component
VRPNPALIEAAAASSPARNGPLTVIVQDLSRSGIYALRSDGGLRKLVDCPKTKCPVLQSFAWAPSGQLIAFDVSWEPPADSADYEGIHILNLSTGADQRIVGGGLRIDDLAWSPDGSRLAYVTDNEAGTAREIRVIAADGSSPSTVVETGVGTPSSPTWSSDGGRLAYAVRRGSQSSVYISTLDQAERRLAAVDASAPAWSPGGTVLAVRSCHGINLLTPAGRNVTPHPGIRRCPAFGADGRPVWSPDGRRIAMQTYHGIYAMNSNGTNLQRLTKRVGRLSRWGGPRPSWRPSMN